MKDKNQNALQAMPSGAYATNDSQINGGAISRRKNTVFSLAAMESLDNNSFRSGVIGLK